jgi:N-acetylglucosamine malate deacetylase 1
VNILIIAPHMDDEVLGTGGTICKHVDAGHLVRVLFIANRVYDHQFDVVALDREEKHALKAKGILGYQEVEFARLPDEQLRACFVDILSVIEKTVDEFEPDMVYLNHRNDPHQDHKAVFEAGVIGLRSISKLPKRLTRLACYEIPSSTEQVPPFVEHAFLPNYYVNITSYVSRKQLAMACYETERRPFPHPRSDRGIATLAASRGMASNFEAAEAFMTVREVWV